MTHTDSPVSARPFARAALRVTAAIAATVAAGAMAGCTSSGPTLYKQADADKVFTAVAGTDPVALSTADFAQRAADPEVTTPSDSTCQIISMLSIAPVPAEGAESVTDYVAAAPAPASSLDDGGLDYVAVRLFATAEDAANYRKDVIKAAGSCAPSGAKTQTIDGWETVTLTATDFVTDVLIVKENLLVMVADSDDPTLAPSALVDAANGAMK